MYTRRHFEDLARTLRSSRPEEPKAHWQWRLTVASFAQLFARNNPRFDSERFLRACGCPGI
jgi:hypothetical protein